MLSELPRDWILRQYTLDDLSLLQRVGRYGLDILARLDSSFAPPLPATSPAEWAAVRQYYIDNFRAARTSLVTAREAIERKYLAEFWAHKQINEVNPFDGW